MSKKARMIRIPSRRPRNRRILADVWQQCVIRFRRAFPRFSEPAPTSPLHGWGWATGWLREKTRKATQRPNSHMSIRHEHGFERLEARQMLANVVNLFTPDGFLFDVQSGGVHAGQLVNGTNNAFDGASRLRVDGVDYATIPLALESAVVIANISTPNIQGSQVRSLGSGQVMQLNELNTTAQVNSPNDTLYIRSSLSLRNPSSRVEVEFRLLIDGGLVKTERFEVDGSLGSPDLGFAQIDLDFWADNLTVGNRDIRLEVRHLGGPTIELYGAFTPHEMKVVRFNETPNGVPSASILANITTQLIQGSQVRSLGSGQVMQLNELNTTAQVNSPNDTLYIQSSLSLRNPSSRVEVEFRLLIDGGLVKTERFEVDGSLGSPDLGFAQIDLEFWADNLTVGNRDIRLEVRHLGGPTIELYGAFTPHEMKIVRFNETPNGVPSASILANISTPNIQGSQVRSLGSGQVMQLNELNTTAQVNSPNDTLYIQSSLSLRNPSSRVEVEFRLFIDGGLVKTERFEVDGSLGSPDLGFAQINLEFWADNLAVGNRDIRLDIRHLGGPTIELYGAFTPHEMNVVRFNEMSTGAVLDDGGRTVLTEVQNIGGLNVSREVTVPTAGGISFVRTIDVFHNPTSNSISRTARIYGNLGSDSETNVFATFDGNGIADLRDQWIATDDFNPAGGTPSLVHYIHGPNGLTPVSAIVVGDNIEWTYSITVPAGETVRLASFLIQASTRSQAISNAQSLASQFSLSSLATQYLSQAEINSIANFQFNTAPVVAANLAAVSANEGSTVSNTGTFSDAQGNGTVTITASVGTVTQNNTNGTWSWSLGVNDNTVAPVSVTITATDNLGAAASTAFSYSVLNVAPTVEISGNSSVAEGSPYSLNLSVTGDPGADTISSWFIDWGDGSDPDNDSVVGETIVGNPSSATHVYADGTSSFTILASATDEDGTYAAQTVGSNAIVSLDPGFGVAGVVRQDFVDSTNDYVRDAVFILPDGKILVVGYLQGGITRMAMARYNVNGTLDTTFGSGGTVITEFDLSQTAESVVLDPTGRILVAGSDGIARFDANGLLDPTFGIGGLNNTFTGLNRIVFDSNGKIVVSGSNRLARLFANGTIDNSFDGDGQLLTGSFSVQDFVIDASGNHIVVGYLYNGTNYDIAVRRYSSQGQLDTGYGNAGTRIIDFGGQQGDFGYAIVLHGNGVLVGGRAGGTYTAPTYDFYDQVLIRLDANGTPDAGFGAAGTGIVRHGLGTPFQYGTPSAIKIDSLGRILVASSAGLSRFTASGLLDNTFDGDGISTFPGISNIQSIDFDSSDKIIVGGTRGNGSAFGSGQDFAIARLNADNGSLDTTFGVGGNDGNGVVSTDFVGSTSDSARDLVVVLPDGKILAVGNTAAGSSDIVLARYLPDGTLDTTFAAGDGDGFDGIAITDFGGGYENAENVAVDSLGNIYVSYGNVVIRYNSNGVLDTGFGTSLGRAFTGLSHIYDMAVDANDQVVVAGYRYQASPVAGIISYDLLVSRLLNNGSPDPSFGTAGIASIDTGTTSTIRKDDFARAMAIDSSGRIVITGYSTSSTLPANTFISQNPVTMRFNPNGTLDGSFGVGGFVESTLVNASNQNISAIGQSVVVDNSDRIIIGTGSHLLRFDNSGTPDSTFDGDGIVTAVASSSRVAIDADGKLLTAGSNRIARYNENGSPDTSFAAGGQLSTSLGSFLAITVDSSNRILVAGSSSTTSNTGSDFLLARFITEGLSVSVQNVAPQIVSFNAPANGVEGTSFALQVVATDPAGVADPLTYSWNITLNGNAYQQASGSAITVTPLDNGTYVATVTVNDGDGGIVVSSRTITVTNVAPTGNFATPTTVNEGDPINLSIGNPVDPSATDTTIGFSYAFDFGSGYNAFSSSNSATLPASDNGLLTVKGKIRDKDGGVTEYTASITINNVAPTAVNDAGMVSEDGPTLAISAIANDTDPAGTQDPLTIISVNTTGTIGSVSFTSGQISYNPNGQFDYLALGESTTDTFTYTISDGDGGVATALVAITITGANDGPSVGAAVTASASEDASSFSVNLLSGATDPDTSDVLNVNGLSLTSGDASGITTVGNSLTVNPNAYNHLAVGESAVIVYSYNVVDGNGGSVAQTATITITGANDGPSVGAAVTASASEDDGTFNVNLLASSSDPDNSDVLNVNGLSLTSGDASGITTVGNSLTVNPNAYNHLAVGQSEVIVYSYNVIDGNGGSIAQTATVTITGQNDAPVFQSGTAFAISENSVDVVTLSASDLDSNPVAFGLSGNGPDDALFEVTATGKLRFIAPADFETPLDSNGDNVYEVEVFVDDGNGGVTLQAIHVTVLNQASITGTVFVDVNGNGLMEANEPGIDGVSIQLLDVNGNAVLDGNYQPITAITSDGGFYLFEDLDPGTYRIRELQPSGVSDGADLLGTHGGLLVANDTMQLTLDRNDAADYAFAELGQHLTSGDTASIGFWQNKHGQALIRLGGTALAAWLTDNFGNVFGSEFGVGVGDDGLDVATFYKEQLFKQKAQNSSGPAKVDAQFMATALATFFTSSNLAGNAAISFGFNVTQTGIGTKIFNVGNSGAAFGVANGTNLTIMQMLWATNSLTDAPDNISGSARIYDLDGDGVISAYEKSLRTMANHVYSQINGTD